MLFKDSEEFGRVESKAEAREGEVLKSALKEPAKEVVQ